MNGLNWMKSFSPKLVKLSISALVKFEIRYHNDAITQIDDFSLFVTLFRQVCDIKVWFQLQWHYFNDSWESVLQKVWKCLKTIKKIKIMIFGLEVNLENSIILRTLLFGELASFTEITQLSFISKVRITQMFNFFPELT